MTLSFQTFIQEIDCPISLDIELTQIWKYQLDEDEKNIADMIKNHLEGKKERTNVENIRRFVKIIFIVVMTPLYILGMAFFLQLGFNLLKNTQDSNENPFILFSLAISLCILALSLLLLITTLILNQLIPSSMDYLVRCLQFRDDSLHVEFADNKRDFWLKSVDYDWNLYKLFEIETFQALFAFGFALACGGFGTVLLLAQIRLKERDQLGYTLDPLNSIFTLFLFGISLLIFGSIGKEIYKQIRAYIAIKKKVLITVEKKVNRIDSYISKPEKLQTLSEFEFTQALLIQLKLSRVRDDLEKLPSVPFAHFRIIMYGFTIITTSYSLTAFILSQILILLG